MAIAIETPALFWSTSDLRTSMFWLRLRAPLLGSPIVGTDYESWVWRLAVC